MSRGAVLPPAVRLSAFYGASFLVAGIQLPFWPVWLASRGLGAEEIGMLLAMAIWAKVFATPAIGAIVDRSGARRSIMVSLAAIALLGYAGLAPAGGLWSLVLLNLVTLTAQSALMPLGDTITLGLSRSAGLDYGRIRVWGSVSFILASLGSGAVLTGFSENGVLLLVLAASAMLLLACIGVPRLPYSADGTERFSGVRAVLRDLRFWTFVLTASALQASHQVYYGFGTLYWRSLDFSDATIGLLWAEGVLAEIVLFWFGQPLVSRIGPIGLMVMGGVAGILRWSLAGAVSSLPFIGALQLLHAFTFGASHLGAMHFLSRAVPLSMGASAQSVYAAASAGLGSGLVMMVAGALYGAYGGGAFPFMAVLSAAGLFGALRLRFDVAAERNRRASRGVG
jgi:MFS transporter, PPP family, 3-phenylpropionic acid transporter